jgi:hypothetical protein
MSVSYSTYHPSSKYLKVLILHQVVRAAVSVSPASSHTAWTSAVLSKRPHPHHHWREGQILSHISRIRFMDFVVVAKHRARTFTDLKLTFFSFTMSPHDRHWDGTVAHPSEWNSLPAPRLQVFYRIFLLRENLQQSVSAVKSFRIFFEFFFPASAKSRLNFQFWFINYNVFDTCFILFLRLYRLKGYNFYNL